MIEEGNVYKSVDPREAGRQIRVTSYYPGNPKAHVVSHPDGKRPRQISVEKLHEGPKTKTGADRRSGYVLVGKHRESADM